MIRSILTFIVVIVWAGLWCGGCSTIPPPEVISPDLSLKRLCEKYEIQWQWDSLAQIVTLSRNQRRVKGFIDSGFFLIDDEAVQLQGPLKWQKSVLLVPSDFQSKIIHLLLEEKKEAPLRPGDLVKYRRIIIDPGHGGKDPGTIGRSGIFEKHVVLDISRRMKRDLERRGVDVYLTRDRDEFISLQKRTEIASQSQSDLFISIHANSSPSRRAQGLEVYTLKQLEEHEKNEEQFKNNQEMMFKRFSMLDNPLADIERILADMLQVHKHAESLALAEYISGHISPASKIKTRGHKTAKFFVLRNTLIPAVLVEVGFLSNPREERLLKTSSYRQTVADTLTRNILDYASL